MITIKNKLLYGYKFIDLFAGIGGFRIALESFGARCVFSSEWDSNAQKTYKANFNEVPQGDITKIDEKDIPDHNILCAGFPCQPFSISGKQKGFNDARGTLFFDVARIVKQKKPEIVLMENVRNFESHDHGNTLKVVKNTMNELGYNFYYQVLDASKYGIPQKRERIYMFCPRKDLKILDFKFPSPIELTKHVCDLLQAEDEIDPQMYKNGSNLQLKKDIDYYSDDCVRIGTVNNGGQGDRIYSTKGVGITLSAMGGGLYSKTGGYLVNGKIRKLTPRECARMMGFPESFKIVVSNSQAYKQFGNSVVVDVLQRIIQEIARNPIFVIKDTKGSSLFLSKHHRAE